MYFSWVLVNEWRKHFVLSFARYTQRIAAEVASESFKGQDCSALWGCWGLAGLTETMATSVAVFQLFCLRREVARGQSFHSFSFRVSFDVLAHILGSGKQCGGLLGDVEHGSQKQATLVLSEARLGPQGQGLHEMQGQGAAKTEPGPSLHRALHRSEK